MIKDKVDQLLQDDTKLPSMSSVVAKVLMMVQDPNVDIQNLAKEISKDPGITASVIKLSNSSYYSPSKPVRSIHEALMTIGTTAVKEIVLLVASKDVLNKDIPSYQLEGENIWKHSLMVAELGSRIAIDKKVPIPKDVVFTAGLLIDLGKFVLGQVFPLVAIPLKAEMKEMRAPFTELERKYFGYSHMEISELLLKKWNFPIELIDSVAYYNDPSKSKVNQLLVSCVHIAHIIAVSSGIGVDIGGLLLPLSPYAVDKTGITEFDIENYFVHLPEIQRKIADLEKI
jgi:HD-like signal output (HDOD) protein